MSECNDRISQEVRGNVRNGEMVAMGRGIDRLRQLTEIIYTWDSMVST